MLLPIMLLILLMNFFFFVFFSPETALASLDVGAEIDLVGQLRDVDFEAVLDLVQNLMQQHTLVYHTFEKYFKF